MLTRTHPDDADVDRNSSEGVDPSSSEGVDTMSSEGVDTMLTQTALPTRPERVLLMCRSVAVIS